MEKVSVRELRNAGGDVLARVVRGESLVVTRDGTEVAELRPRRRPAPRSADLVERRRWLPAVDPVTLRHDLDQLLDPGL